MSDGPPHEHDPPAGRGRATPSLARRTPAADVRSRRHPPRPASTRLAQRAGPRRSWSSRSRWPRRCFVLPFRAWLDQRRELAESKAELAGLQAANDRLDAENDQLQTAEGVGRGGPRRPRLPTGRRGSGRRPAAAGRAARAAPGWPYDVVTQILAVRTVAAPPRRRGRAPPPRSHGVRRRATDPSPTVPRSPDGLAVSPP